MQGVSIVICCYNSSCRIPETLRHIALQEVASDIPWEVIIVNNASKDNTVEIANAEWIKYNCTANFTLVDQPIPGLSAAREKGIEVSAFEYIIFCDDDNWLNENYVNTAFETMESHPDAGIVGGQSIGFFEIEKPFWFDKFSQSFVVEKPLSESNYLAESREYLAGAGMIIRKDFIKDMQAVGFKPILTDRIGKSLMSGGDYELCLIAKYLGYRIFYEENLGFVHFMSEERLNWDYCLRMTTEGHAIPEIIYDIYRSCFSCSQSNKKQIFVKLYYKLMLFYLFYLIFPEERGIKGILSFFTNIHLFFHKQPGSVIQRKLLSSKNKLLFLINNRKLLKQNFILIQQLFIRIKNYRLNIENT
ncbi:MAG: glycosyltransferase family 2 protein [Bacteroidetes bacterium]|nr:glycosyltransferase family 2 protein [Bacteroidota bacterium]